MGMFNITSRRCCSVLDTSFVLVNIEEEACKKTEITCFCFQLGINSNSIKRWKAM